MVDQVPYDKGFLGVDYRTQLSLHRSSTGASAAFEPGDPAWDIYLGALPFMLAPAPDTPYIRESAPISRDRFDSARDPGEQSLNPSVWLRSWTSWHLGAGQEYAEPLETDPEIARFRFSRSGGVNPWHQGEMSLLYRADPVGAAEAVIAVDGKGVVAATLTGIKLFATDGTSITLSSSVCTKLSAAANNWVGISSGSAVYGGYTAGSSAGTAIATITGATAVAFAKDRWWVGAGRDLWEVTALGTAPVKVHTFNEQASIVDIDTGPGGIYVMVNDGQTRIYIVTALDDGSLNAPRELSSLPRGESGNYLYGYLGRYLVIGTSRGVRIADSSNAESLPVGPLTIEMTGGCRDATANANFLWVTTGSEGIDTLGDGTAIDPGLYRIDLSRVVKSGQGYGDTAASLYAYASDIYYEGAAGVGRSVTHFDGRLWLVVGSTTGSDGLLAQESTTATYATGWFETGKVSFSTAELKAWQSVSVDVGGAGSLAAFADTGSGFTPVVQSSLRAPYVGDADIDSLVHPASGSIGFRVMLFNPAPTTSRGPLLESFGLRALPNPRRTRYIRLPLLCFDLEDDRFNSPIGYEGFSSDRIFDVEAMENRGGLIALTDTRTGEVVRGQVDKMSFVAATPPSSGTANYGGFLTVTILVV